MVMCTNIAVESAQLRREFEFLSILSTQLKNATSLDEKIELLTALPRVEEFLRLSSILRSFLRGISQEHQLVIKAIIAIGQGQRVFSFPTRDPEALQKLQSLVEELLEVEYFYREIGGIVGYHFSNAALLAR